MKTSPTADTPARAFRLFGSAQLAFLQAHAAGVIAGWAGEWLRDAAPAVQVQPAGGAAPLPGPWLTLGAGQGGPACHAQREAGAAERLVFGAVAAQQPSALAREAADAAVLDLARRCLAAGAVPMQPLQSMQPPAPAEWQRGSGALRIDVTLPAGRIELLLGGLAVGRWLAQRPRSAPVAPAPLLHELRSASGSGRVRLQGWTGHAEIDIATLQSLAVGDVIQLDLRVDQPLRLSIDGRPALRRAFLGSHAGRRALGLTASSDQPDFARPGLDP